MNCGKKFYSNHGCKSRLPKYCCHDCYVKQLTGTKQTKESRSKRSKVLTGKHRSEEQKLRMSKAQLRLVQEGKHHWSKGGITPISQAIRSSQKYNDWRLSVFKRDNFICCECRLSKPHEFEVHHKKALSILIDEAKETFPSLKIFDAALIYSPIWDINNGVTLCKDCHKEITLKENLFNKNNKRCLVPVQ